MDNIRLFKKSDIIIITVAIIIAAVFFVLPVLNRSDDKKVYVTKFIVFQVRFILHINETKNLSRLKCFLHYVYLIYLPVYSLIKF